MSGRISTPKPAMREPWSWYAAVPALNRPPVELGSVHRSCGGSTMRLASAIAFVLTTVLGAMPGHAQTRAALVISNGGYQNAPVLPNPINDANDIAASLERLGFSVRRVINGAFEDMRRALRDFAPQARGPEMAMVYFAGHGENWLIPVDAELKMDIAANHEAIAPLSAAEEQVLKPKDSFKCPFRNFLNRVSRLDSKEEA